MELLSHSLVTSPLLSSTPLISNKHTGRWGISGQGGAWRGGRLKRWNDHTHTQSKGFHLGRQGRRRESVGERDRCLGVSQTSEVLVSTWGFHRDRDRLHRGCREHDARRKNPHTADGGERDENRSEGDGGGG